MAETAPPKAAKGPFWALAIATVFGLGHTPRMPGTMGSAVGLFLFVPALLLPKAYAMAVGSAELLAVLVLGALAVPPVLRASGLRDPGFVVIDEVAGMLAALAFWPPDFVHLLLAFVFFRLLDILKPFPINRLERLPGAWGVMADDLAAGALAGLFAYLAMRLA